MGFVSSYFLVGGGTLRQPQDLEMKCNHLRASGISFSCVQLRLFDCPGDWILSLEKCSPITGCVVQPVSLRSLICFDQIKWHLRLLWNSLSLCIVFICEFSCSLFTYQHFGQTIAASSREWDLSDLNKWHLQRSWAFSGFNVERIGWDENDGSWVYLSISWVTGLWRVSPVVLGMLTVIKVSLHRINQFNQPGGIQPWIWPEPVN